MGGVDPKNRNRWSVPRHISSYDGRGTQVSEVPGETAAGLRHPNFAPAALILRKTEQNRSLEAPVGVVLALAEYA